MTLLRRIVSLIVSCLVGIVWGSVLGAAIDPDAEHPAFWFGAIAVPALGAAVGALRRPRRRWWMATCAAVAFVALVGMLMWMWRHPSGT